MACKDTTSLDNLRSYTYLKAPGNSRTVDVGTDTIIFTASYINSHRAGEPGLAGDARVSSAAAEWHKLDSGVRFVIVRPMVDATASAQCAAGGQPA